MDLFSPEFRRNPFPVYDRLRAAAPLLHEPSFDAWMIFDYAGAKEAPTAHAFRNPRRLVSSMKASARIGRIAPLST